jgi:hypothetical protein
VVRVEHTNFSLLAFDEQWFLSLSWAGGTVLIVKTGIIRHLYESSMQRIQIILNTDSVEETLMISNKIGFGWTLYTVYGKMVNVKKS